MISRRTREREFEREMGARYPSAVSPSESDESFVSAELDNIKESSSDQAPPPPTSLSSSSSLSRREGHQPLASAASTSPIRNGKIKPRAPKDPDATPLASQRLSDPTSSHNGSYFTPHPGSSLGHESRSPTTRRPRPPASRSSHGIETLSGPPPALSTQRSYNNADLPWRGQSSVDQKTTSDPSLKRGGVDHSIECVLQDSTTSAHDRRYSEPTRVADGSRTLSTTESYNTAALNAHDADLPEEDQDHTVRVDGQRMPMRRHMALGNDDQHLEASPEDLFLGLAKEDSVTDDASEAMSRSERRRSRFGIQSRASLAPSSSARPSTSGAQFPSHNTPSSSRHYIDGSSAFDKPATLDSLTSLRNDIARHRPYAASAHPLEEVSRAPQRFIPEKASYSSPMQHYSPEFQRAIGRRRSIQATSSVLAFNSSETMHLPRRSRYASPPFADTPRQDDGTESTVSTRAASTVWDELSDMKSRIRQLELTGKIPSSSNAAISNALGDRPQTAGTTMTNLSSSPKRHKRHSLSPEISTAQVSEMAEIRPLLYSALKRSKEILNADIYQTLEATATDTLALSRILGEYRSQESEIERQLRRRVDGMCRSLTELCIALAGENASPGPRLLAGSKDAPVTPYLDEPAPDSRLLSGVSEDPELRASSRVMSRLESRRTSLLDSGAHHVPRDILQEPTNLNQPATKFASKLDRTNSVLRRREIDDERMVLRAPSRAATEIGQTRPSPQSRMSREYISNYPLPKLPQRSPSVQSSLSTQKGYFHSATNSPVTPNNNALPATRRHAPSSNPPSSDSTRLAEARQRRLASLGQSHTAGHQLGARNRLNESKS